MLRLNKIPICPEIRPTVEARRLEHDMTVLQPETKERRNTSMNHATSMFQRLESARSVMHHIRG